MPKLEAVLRADINPLEPGPELCAVIDGVLQYHPLPARVEILKSLREEISKGIEVMEKEVKKQNGVA